MISVVTTASRSVAVEGQETRKVWDTMGRRRGGRGCLTTGTVGQRPLTVADVSAGAALPAYREPLPSSDRRLTACPAQSPAQCVPQEHDREHTSTVYKHKLVNIKNSKVRTLSLYNKEDLK